jgi:hypothetical protein
MRIARHGIVVVGAGLLLGSCSKEEPPVTGAVASPPAGTAPAASPDAKTFLQGFLDPAKRPAQAAGLKPDRADYEAVFGKDLAAKVEAAYQSAWAGGDPGIGPKEGQTEVLVWKATTEELRAGTGDAKEFPGGWKTAAEKLSPGLTFHRFKFVKPGEATGMAYDGLIFLNGRWRMFPKPWRALEK